jgi:DNA-binding NarL/FixJ family response regulator
MTSKKPRVLIVDDHPVVRMGLRAMFERSGDYEVCGEAGTPSEALSLLAREQPDALILDLMLGGHGGADFVAQCKQHAPATRVLVLSQHDEALYAERVLAAGAHGYVMKGEELEGVVEALSAIMRGEIVLSPRMNARVLPPRSGRPLFRPVQPRDADLSSDRRRAHHRRDCGRAGAQPQDRAHREHIKVKLGLTTAAELEREALLHVERMD